MIIREKEEFLDRTCIIAISKAGQIFLNIVEV